MTDARFAGIGMTSARTRDRLVQRLREQGITNLAVLDRMKNVPRHIFVDEALGSRAYEDTALPIGFGQTISQPYIVARMTEALLEYGSVDRILEVGTGCGYQTAVLAPLVGRIYTIERIAPLVERAKARMKDLDIKNVRLKHGDGIQGWKSMAPFDGILVAAAFPQVPTPLAEQLADDGRLVQPIGLGGNEEVVLFEKRDGLLVRKGRVTLAHFVRLFGEHGFAP
jgi:protein-L-isoaspartate(D-aspartate) O-methyltransferase